jgi:4-carboxymuconolactone decarboxylase
MDERTRALVALSASLARGSRGEWRDHMTRALQVCSAAEVEEAILQSYLFLGYPVALQALAVWREVVAEPASVEHAADATMWRGRGEEVCTAVYGGQYDRLRENVVRLHPDVEQWMLLEGYGKIIGRPGLDLKTRELCIIALLASQEAPHQLFSHLRGALQTGSTVSEVDDVVLSVVRSLPTERAQQARQQWSELRARKQQKTDDEVESEVSGEQV